MLQVNMHFPSRVEKNDEYHKLNKTKIIFLNLLEWSIHTFIYRQGGDVAQQLNKYIHQK